MTPINNNLSPSPFQLNLLANPVLANPVEDAADAVFQPINLNRILGLQEKHPDSSDFSLTNRRITVENQIENIFHIIDLTNDQDEILESEVRKETNTSESNTSISAPIYVSIDNFAKLPEAANPPETSELSTYLLDQGIVPEHLTSSKSIRINIKISFIQALCRNTEKENKEKISKQIKNIGEGNRAASKTTPISGVELLEMLNLPENAMFFQENSIFRKQTLRYVERCTEVLFLPPVLNPADERVETTYNVINTLFQKTKDFLDENIRTYFESYLSFVEQQPNLNLNFKLSFEISAITHLLEQFTAHKRSIKIDRSVDYAYRKVRKAVSKPVKPKLRVVEKKRTAPDSVEEKQNKVAKTATEQAESSFNPFDLDEATYLLLASTPPNGEFPFPFQD